MKKKLPPISLMSRRTVIGWICFHSFYFNLYHRNQVISAVRVFHLIISVVGISKPFPVCRLLWRAINQRHSTSFSVKHASMRVLLIFCHATIKVSLHLYYLLRYLTFWCIIVVWYDLEIMSRRSRLDLFSFVLFQSLS